MDSSSPYIFREMIEGQMKKILTAVKEFPMKKGQAIVRIKSVFTGMGVQA